MQFRPVNKTICNHKIEDKNDLQPQNLVANFFGNNNVVPVPVVQESAVVIAVFFIVSWYGILGLGFLEQVDSLLLKE